MINSVAVYQMVYFQTQIWVNFAGSCNRRCWCLRAILSILRTNGIFYGHLVDFIPVLE
jgi:hypothetical protein